MQRDGQHIVSLSVLVGFILYTYITYPDSNLLSDAFTVDNQHYAIFLSLALLTYPLEKIIKNGLKVIVETDLLLVSSFVYWTLLDVIQSRYPLTDVTLHAVKFTFIYIALFNIFIILGSNFSFSIPSIVKETATTDVNGQTLFYFFIASFFIAMFYYWQASYYDVQYMIKALNRARFNAPWARGNEGGVGAIIEHLKYIGYFLPSVAVLYAIKVRKVDFKVILVFAMAIFFSAFEFQGGGRRITGFLVGIAVVTYLVYKRHHIQIRHLIFLVIAAGGLLVLLDMQLAFRNKGYENMFEKYEIDNLTEVRVDDNFYRIAQLIDWIPALYPHAGAQWLVYSFGRPIPRFLWEGKPIDPGYDVAKMAGEFGVTLTTTIVGEAYAAGGVFMLIIIGLFYGAIAGTIRNMLRSNLAIMGYSLYSIATLAIVGGVRALVDMIIFFYAFLGLVVLYRFFLKKRLMKENIFRNAQIVE